MSYLSKSVREEMSVGPRLGSPSKRRARQHMRVKVGDAEVRIIRQWDSGFAVATPDAHMIHGRVDVYDGARHLCRALVVAGDEEAGEQQFEFKSTTPAAATAPPADFTRE